MLLNFIARNVKIVKGFIYCRNFIDSRRRKPARIIRTMTEAITPVGPQPSTVTPHITCTKPIGFNNTGRSLKVTAIKIAYSFTELM